VQPPTVPSASAASRAVAIPECFMSRSSRVLLFFLRAMSLLLHR
jgi:hypothetical protein